MKEDLGITPKQRQELCGELNAILNCAARLDFDARIDVSVRANALGPLLLLKLAEECPKMQCLVQVSSTYVNCDRTGFVEETLYDSKINWQQEMTKVLTMSQRDLRANER